MKTEYQRREKPKMDTKTEKPKALNAKIDL